MSQNIKSNKNQSNQQTTSQIQEESSGQLQQQKSEKQSNTTSHLPEAGGSKDNSGKTQMDFGGVGSLNQNSTEFKNPVQKVQKQPKNSQSSATPASPSKKKQKVQNLSKNQPVQQLSPAKGEQQQFDKSATSGASKQQMVFGSWYDTPSSNKEGTQKQGKNPKSKKGQKEIEKTEADKEDTNEKPHQSVNEDQIQPTEHTVVTNEDQNQKITKSKNKEKEKDNSIQLNDPVIVEEQKEGPGTPECLEKSSKLRNKGNGPPTPKDVQQPTLPKVPAPSSSPPVDQQYPKDQNMKGQNANKQYDSWSTKNSENYAHYPNPDYERRQNRQPPAYNNLGKKQGGNGGYLDQHYDSNQNQYQDYPKNQYYNDRNKKGFKHQKEYDNYKGSGYSQYPPYDKSKYYEEYEQPYDSNLYYKQKTQGAQTHRMDPAYANEEYTQQSLTMQKQNSWGVQPPLQPQIQHKKKKSKHTSVVVTTNNEELTSKEPEVKTTSVTPEVQESQPQINQPPIIEESKEEAKTETIPPVATDQPVQQEASVSQVVKEEVKQKSSTEQTTSQKKKKKQNKGNVQTNPQVEPIQPKQEVKQKETVEEEKKDEKKDKVKAVPSERKEALTTHHETAVNRLHLQRSKSLSQLPKKSKKYQQKEKEEEKVAQICEMEVKGTGNEKKIHKLDPDVKKGKPILVVISIQTRERIVEATIREGTNINFLNEKISVLADFKNCPKKFKEIFQCYLKNQYTSALTQKQIQIILGNNPSSQLQFQSNNENQGGSYGDSNLMNSVQNQCLNNLGAASPNNLYQQSMMVGQGGLNQYGQITNNSTINQYQTDEQQKQHLINRLQQSINAMPEFESPYENGTLMQQYSQLAQHISQTQMPQQKIIQQENIEKITPQKKQKVQQRNSEDQADIVKNVDKAQSDKSTKCDVKKCSSLPPAKRKDRRNSANIIAIDNKNKLNMKKRQSPKSIAFEIPLKDSPDKDLLKISKINSSPKSDNKEKQNKSEPKHKKQKDQGKNKDKINKSVNFLDHSNKQDHNKQSNRDNFQEVKDQEKKKMDSNKNFCGNLPNPLFGPPAGEQNSGEIRYDQQTSKNNKHGLDQKENVRNTNSSQMANTAIQIPSGNYLHQPSISNPINSQNSNQNILHPNPQALTNLSAGTLNTKNATTSQMNPSFLPFQQNFNITVPQISPFQQMQTAMGNPTQATGFNPNPAVGLIPHHNTSHLGQTQMMETNNSIHNQYQIPHQAHQKQQYNNQFAGQNNQSLPNSFSPNPMDNTSLEKLQNQIKNQIGNMITNSQQYQHQDNKMNYTPLNQLNGQPINPLQSQQPFQQLDYTNQNHFYGSQWNNQMLPQLGNQMNSQLQQLQMNNQASIGRDGQVIGTNHLQSMPQPIGFQTGTNFSTHTNQPVQTPMKAGTQEVGPQQNHTQNYHKTQRQNNNQMNSNMGMQNQNNNNKSSKNSNNNKTQSGSKNNNNTTNSGGHSGSNGLPMDGSQQRSVQLVQDQNASQVANPNNLNNQQMQTNMGQQYTPTPTNFGVSQGQEHTQLSQQQLQQAQHQQPIIQNLVFYFQMGNQGQMGQAGIGDPNQLQMMQNHQNLIEGGAINARANAMLGTNSAIQQGIHPQSQQHLEQRNQEMSRGNPNINSIMTNNQHPQQNAKTQKQHSQINKNSNSDQAHHRRQEVAQDQTTAPQANLNTNEQRQGYSSQFQAESPSKQI